MTPHPDEGTLHALLDGEIPSAELPPLTAHLDRCAECARRLAEARALRAEADGLVTAIEVPEPALRVAASPDGPARPPAGARATPGVVPNRRPSGGPGWRVSPLAWAATLVLAAGLGYLARDAGLARPAVQGERETAGPADGLDRNGAPVTGAPGGTDPRGPAAVPEASVQAQSSPASPEPAAPAPVAPGPQARRPLDADVPAEKAGERLADMSAAAPPAGAAALPRPAARAATSEADRANAVTITGHVVDSASRRPVVGALVAVAETRQAVVTDSQGAFRLEAPAGKSVALLARALGYRPRRETIAAPGSGRTAQELALTAEPHGLQELVITGVATQPATLEAARRILGGEPRRIEGLPVTAVEVQADTVRLGYDVAGGRLWLVQHREAGRLRHRLLAPPGFPADTIARLLARVRD